MAIDATTEAAPGGARIDPMRIAQHPLFTAREKLDLLRQLRAEVAAGHTRDLGFGAGDIDRAIEELKRGVQSGEASDIAPMGDN